jgi:steroid 5-alpha reductase family enzyme
MNDKHLKNLLHSFFELWVVNQGFREKAAAYKRALKTEEWRFLNDVILTIQGEMLSDMFSKQFTRLPDQEKDVIQRTYYNLNQILNFIKDPVGWCQKKSMRQANLNQRRVIK